MTDIAQGIARWVLSGPEGWACGFVLVVYATLPLANWIDRKLGHHNPKEE